MTAIEWTDEVWNPVTGCSHVSAGCKNCYAERFAGRGMGPWKGRAFGDVRCHPERLGIPFQWKKPRRVFVNSMSDLFHESVPDEFVDEVLLVMWENKQHDFQILTKRPKRMLDYFGSIKLPKSDEFPFQNIWLGVSVEDQRTADERILFLLQTPAAVRFVSYEPALGPVNIPQYLHSQVLSTSRDGLLPDTLPGIDWLICGGESGPKARPFDIEWLRSAVRQCKAASVPVFVKQLGANCYNGAEQSCETSTCVVHEYARLRTKDRKGGDPSEWPEDLRVREFPR